MSFQETSRIGVLGMNDIIPFIRARAKNGQFVTTDKGQLSEMLQKLAGDFLMNMPDGSIHSIELKTEFEDKYGNFFLETWSNRKFGMQTTGWMIHMRCDWLFYYFYSTKELYIIPFKRLWEWFHGNECQGPHDYHYPLKLQSKHDQLNQTYGRPVRIEDVKHDVGFKKFTLEDGKWVEVVEPAAITQPLLFNVNPDVRAGRY